MLAPDTGRGDGRDRPEMRRLRRDRRPGKTRDRGPHQRTARRAPSDARRDVQSGPEPPADGQTRADGAPSSVGSTEPKRYPAIPATAARRTISIPDTRGLRLVHRAFTTPIANMTMPEKITEP